MALLKLLRGSDAVLRLRLRLLLFSLSRLLRLLRQLRQLLLP